MALSRIDEFRIMDMDQALDYIQAHYGLFHFDVERGVDS